MVGQGLHSFVAMSARYVDPREDPVLAPKVTRAVSNPLPYPQFIDGVLCGKSKVLHRLPITRNTLRS
jgi:hypothetical protein